jgi:ketosteroid isomerase-like protein
LGRIFLWLGSALVLFTGCKTSDYQKALLDTDRAFAEAARAQGTAAAFKAFAAVDAMLLPQGEQPVVGREAIYRGMLASDNAGALTWSPRGGDVSRSGDLGYTWGEYQFYGSNAPSGAVAYGKYVTVWRRQADGSWKFVADIGNPNPRP